MGQLNYKWDKILELIFENPNEKFTIREISKRTKIPSSSVQRYVEILRKEGLITNENRARITHYLKFRKTFLFIDKMYKTGLIDYLIERLNPSVMILFGSVRKGEYEKESDIDLFVESQVDKEVDLRRYEKLLGHNIQLFLESDINKVGENLFINLINGIKIYGSFKFKQGEKR